MIGPYERVILRQDILGTELKQGDGVVVEYFSLHLLHYF